MLKTSISLAQLSRLFHLLMLLLLSFESHAYNESQVLSQQVINAAIEKTLWMNTEWLNLLHINKEGDKYLSQVDDKRFFYAEDGKSNPQAELIATLKQLFIEEPNHNTQTQCRFIARSEWLIKKLKINKKQLPEVQCDEYLEWYEQAQADSITLVFPAYHLNSPSSMFGHTLLRLDKSDKSQSEWLSFAVNFGADTSNNDNSFMYAYQGLAGGYPGLFITEPYFKKIQEYNRIEHRDIWEYKLNLTANETNIVIKHLWELKTINFDYYFFDENCSYRLLELIEVARPGLELTDEFVLTAIPVDTVRAIENAQLIESVKFRPARATKVQFILNEMSVEQRSIVLLLSEDFTISQSKRFTNLKVSEQKKVADLSYQYLRYQNTKEARNPVIVKRSYQLLQLLNSYSADINVEPTIPMPFPPEKSHKSRRVTVSPGERLNNKYIEFGYKMSFHDLEDNKSGFLKGAQINIGSIKLRAEDNVGLRLYQLDLVNIFSLTPKNAFFKPLSWKIYTGFERQLTKTKDQLSYHVTGGAGSSWQFLEGHQFYALAILRLETNKQLKNTIEPAIGFNTGILSHFKNTTAHLEFNGEQFQESIYRLRVQYTQNIALSTNHSIKLFAKHEWHEDRVDFSDINLSYQYYF